MTPVRVGWEQDQFWKAGPRCRHFGILGGGFESLSIAA